MDTKIQEDAEKAALELELKVNDMYARMTIPQRDQAKRNAERTLRRAQTNLHKLQAFLAHVQSPTTTQTTTTTTTTTATTNEVIGDVPANPNTNDNNVKSDDAMEEEELTLKHVTRWWRKCLEQVEKLIEDGCGFVFDNVQVFLIDFYRQQNQLESSVENALKLTEIPVHLNQCEKKLQRMIEGMDEKKSLRIVERNKEALEVEVQSLLSLFPDSNNNNNNSNNSSNNSRNSLHVGHKEVDAFLARMSNAMFRFYTEYQPEKAKETKTREQNIRKIGILKSSLESETKVLNKKLELYLKKAQKDYDQQMDIFQNNAQQQHQQIQQHKQQQQQ